MSRRSTRLSGKGFLASDESAGPWLRAGHAEAAKIPETRRNLTQMFFVCYCLYVLFVLCVFFVSMDGCDN